MEKDKGNCFSPAFSCPPKSAYFSFIVIRRHCFKKLNREQITISEQKSTLFSKSRKETHRFFFSTCNSIGKLNTVLSKPEIKKKS